MPRQRPVAHRMTLAGGLAAVIGAAAVIVSLTFANDSAAAETDTGTQRVSVGTGEEQSTHDSREPAISADGRYVAFTTDEPFDPVDKLNVSQDVDGGLAESAPDEDVYVRDTKLGTTTLISHGFVPQEDGTDHIVPARGDSDQPSISADGRFVAFRTTAFNISYESEVASSIMVCDRDPDGDGTLNATCRFTKITTVDEWDPENPHISADGRRISYDKPRNSVILFSAPTAAAAAGPPDTNTGWVEVVNLRLGSDGKLTAPVADDRTYVTAPDALTFGGKKFALDGHFDSTMAAGGTHVAFVADYSLSDNPDAQAVYDYDVATGGLTRLDLDASGNAIGAGGRRFSHPALSGDGRRYAFADRQSSSQISVRLYDRGPTMTGTPSVEIASRTPDGTVGRGAQPAFSADGRYLAFTTPTPGMHNGTDNGVLESSCLGPGDNQSYCDIVVRDVIVDHDRAAAGLPRLPAELASPSAGCTGNPCEGTGDSGLPLTTGGDGRSNGAAVLSSDGAVVAYGSAAADLIAGGADTNRHLDVFRRRFAPALAGDPQDFGQVPLGTEALKDVPLTHVGAGPLSVTAVAVDGADFDVFPGEACTTVVLHATENCIVSVRFKPTVLGPRTASLRVTIAGVETPLTVSLTGTGVTPPAGVPTVAPDKLDFGARPVLQTSPIKSVTVRNTGDGPLSIQTVTLGAPTATTFPSDYQKVTDTCANKAIPVAGSCRIDLRHRPTAVGARPAVLTISYAGPAATLTIPVAITGAGNAPTLTSSPTVTPAGRVIQISGKDFPPGSTAKLSLTGMPGTTTAKARPDGTFKVPFVVLPNTWTGRHQLNADVLPATAPGLSAPLKASLEFVIVPGSPVPPDFDIRK